jgi:hypothetical protein
VEGENKIGCQLLPRWQHGQNLMLYILFYSGKITKMEISQKAAENEQKIKMIIMF